MKLKRIDAYEINFVDSAARPEFKLKKTTGMGEKRIYIGNYEEKFDEFFDFENVECFITEKRDLIKYLDDAYQEYMHPTQNYRVDIAKMYEPLKHETEQIDKDLLIYHFRKKLDTQNRYYIVLMDKDCDRKNYDCIRNIALPGVTKFCFIKYEDEDTGKLYIYMRPILFNNFKSHEGLEINVETANSSPEDLENEKRASRANQSKYRDELLKRMPSCPFTDVADDRILVACHIKPFSKCLNDKERYDYKNGLIMTPTYHILFDLGFISFENDGKLLVSPFLSNITKKRLNLQEGKHINIQNGCDKYLSYHRSNIFCKMPTFELTELDLKSRV